MQQVSTLDQGEGRRRVDAVDVAKGLGIIAVIVGHIIVDSPWVSVIYCFHMPLFFFLSGLLHGEFKRHALPQYVRSRLVPYFAFGLLSMVITLFFRYMRHGAIEPDVVWLALRSLLEGKPVRGTELWFYPCLLIVELIGLALLQTKIIPLRLSLCGVLATIGFLLSPWNLYIPWNIDIAFVALPFWFVGAYARDRDLWKFVGSPLQWWLAVPATVAIIYYKVFVLHSGVDMRTASYGAPFLFYAAAAGGIAATLVISKALSGSKALALVGRASFAIYPTHVLISVFLEILVGRTGIVFHLPRAGVVGLQLVCSILGGIALHEGARKNGLLQFLMTGRYKRPPVLA